MTFKRTVFLVLIFVIANTANSELNYSFTGNISVGLWGAKDYDFTSDKVFNENGDTILGKDRYPAGYLEVMPFGSVGLNIKTNKVDFCFELGIGRCLSSSKYTYTSVGSYSFNYKYSFSVRPDNFYGELHLGNVFSLLGGKSSIPCSFYVTNQLLYWNNGFNTYDALDYGSKPLLQIKISKNFGSIINLTTKIAAIVPDTVGYALACFKTKDTTVFDINGIPSKKALVIHSLILSSAYGEYMIKRTIPRFEGSLDFNLTWKFLHINPQFAGGYQQYTMMFKPYLINSQPPYDYSAKQVVQSYLIGGKLDVGIGPVTIGYAVAGGMNPGVYGVNTINAFRSRRLSNYDIFYPTTTPPMLNGNMVKENGYLNPEQVKDVKTYYTGHIKKMAWFGKVKPVKYLSLEGGFGMIKASHEYTFFDQQWHDVNAWFGRIELFLFDQLTLAPEVGQYRYGPKYGQGQFTFYGLTTSFRF
jgi:hypothetical protein